MRRRAALWPLLAVLAGAAGSTLTTAIAAAVAGREADVALQPLELTLRVALLLAAPCVGALVAALVLPRPAGPPRTVRLTVAGVGVGVPFGPLLVLRMQRVLHFGLGAVLLSLVVLVAWGVVGAVLAAGWWARPERYADRSELPGSDPLG
ncbi:MAG TPA: hypothetical protein VGM21_19295 [Actinomycetota bacterium]|jgi:hypothetical protein